MIERLRIRGLGVIDEAEIGLGPGLVAITGETGAGKTMVLTGLGMLAGQKADPAAVRRGAERAEVDGEWLLGDAALVESLEESGIDLESTPDGAVLLIGRSIAAGGRARATVAGRPVSTGVLEELAGRLVAIHGQAEQQRLRQAAQQRDILDRFGDAPVARARAAFASAFQQWRAAAGELADLQARRGSLEREAAALAAGRGGAALGQLAHFCRHNGQRAWHRNLSHCEPSCPPRGDHDPIKQQPLLHCMDAPLPPPEACAGAACCESR